MNILICDDNKPEASELEGLINASGFDVKIIVFLHPQEVIAHVTSGAAVDVCFLDIIMPEMTGIDLAGALRAGGYSDDIVFLTSSNDFAYQSYRVKAFDYLLKPPTADSVAKILSELENAGKAGDKDGITVKTPGLSRFVPLRDISHMEVINHTVCFSLKGGSQLEVYATFSEYALLLLKDRRFVQCHRSYIVNMSAIEAVGEKEIIMQNGARIPISRGYSGVRDMLLQWMFGGGER